MQYTQNPPSRSAAARIGASVLIGLLAISSGCDRKNDANVYVPPPPPEVVVANPGEREVTAYLHYTGTIEASESVDVRARVQGFLVRTNFEAGQRVKKGDLLFEIDKREYEAAVERAEAAVRAREAALEGAENDARLARELADQRAGPEIDAVIKAARRDMAKADLAQAKAVLLEARLNLEFCSVTAPIDGRITDPEVDDGNLVGRSEPTLLAKIVQAVPAYVYVDVNETDVLAVRGAGAREGTPDRAAPEQSQRGTCELGLSNEAEYRFQGRVDYLAPELDPQTGTLRVRARFENADERLLPGLFARLRFPTSTRKSLVVPEAALLTDQQGRFAMVVNEKNEVEARRIKVGVLDGSYRVVEEGLTPNDKVIVLGVLKARPGSKVSPKLQQAPAAGR